MKHRRSNEPRNSADGSVELNIARLRNDIETWALQNELWFDCGFEDFLSHTGREPLDLPVLSRLWSEGCLARILQGDGPPEIETQFSDILAAYGCWYEFDNHYTLNIYPDEDSDYSAYSSYFHWQWICSLVKEDIGDVYADLYSHFESRPEDLYSLSWRDYEVLLAEVLKTQGFEALLGPGSDDGGVDITLIQRDPIGDILTVVQAKKYAPRNKIQPADVRALYGVQMADRAQNALFVTTSAYSPAAQKFAARENVKMQLATSSEVSGWCRSASRGIIEDKSSLVTPEQVSKILQEAAGSRDNRIVHAHTGYNCVRNEFALVVKESKHAALLMTLPCQVLAHDGFGQLGTEVPSLDGSLPNLNADGVFRTRRLESEGRVSYTDGYRYFSPWDGSPCYFDHYD